MRHEWPDVLLLADSFLSTISPNGITEYRSSLSDTVYDTRSNFRVLSRFQEVLKLLVGILTCRHRSLYNL